VAFAAAEPEGFAVIPAEGDPLGRVARLRAEVTSLDPRGVSSGRIIGAQSASSWGERVHCPESARDN
jgi:hypothetical protein